MRSEVEAGLLWGSLSFHLRYFISFFMILARTGRVGACFSFSQLSFLFAFSSSVRTGNSFHFSFFLFGKEFQVLIFSDQIARITLQSWYFKWEKGDKKMNTNPCFRQTLAFTIILLRTLKSVEITEAKFNNMIIVMLYMLSFPLGTSLIFVMCEVYMK